MSPGGFGVWAVGQPEKKVLEAGEENAVTFIAESIQDAGGAIVPPDTCWPKVREALAKYNILPVVGKTICGFDHIGE